MKFYIDNFINIRKMKKITQEDIAEALNIKQQAIQRWDKGKSKPHVSKLFQLAKILDCEITDISDYKVDVYFDSQDFNI